MIGRPKQPVACENLNHRKHNPPVGHCPQCGGVVNSSLRFAPCDEALHVAARRRYAAFCVQCGTQLIAPYR